MSSVYGDNVAFCLQVHTQDHQKRVRHALSIVLGADQAGQSEHRHCSPGDAVGIGGSTVPT
jgi:hypothetical protein